jgi:hypothetical protein
MLTEPAYFSDLNRRGLWNIAQNKPSLIVTDLATMGVPRDVGYGVLLGRGVFKWLAVRRDLIKLKDVWKSTVTQTIEDIRQAKREHDGLALAYRRGYLKAYEECRREVRALCHSERFRAPDFDNGAKHFLAGLDQDEARSLLSEEKTTG